MRTMINSQGCNTIPGPIGLTVEGDLTVGNMDVVKTLNELLSAPKAVASPAVVVDSSGAEALKASVDLAQKLADLEKSFKKSLTELTNSLVDTQKELEAAQDANKKLTDRVKTLETDLKKASKVVGKKETSTDTEST